MRIPRPSSIVVAVAVAATALVTPRAEESSVEAPVVELVAASRTSKRVAPGIKLIKIRHRRPLQRVFALRVDVSGKPVADVALAQNRLPRLERTRSMAKRHKAIAAVNGDFAIHGGRPARAYAEDGTLGQTSFVAGPNFAVSRDGKKTHMGAPAETITVRKLGAEDLTAHRWNNGKPTRNGSALYSPAGGRFGRPPRNACSARLRGSGGLRWVDGREQIGRDYEVEVARCSKDRLRRRGGVVVSARPGSTDAVLIQSLTPAETVTVSWTFRWPRVMDSLGGFPRLVAKGKVVARRCDASLCARHPRTGLGFTKKGQLLLVVVDGRRPGWSTGMTLKRFATEMKRLGAVNAMNLDGGGSSTMVVRGRIVNRPSDGSERSVSGAVLVHRRRDKGEAVGEPSPLDPLEALVPLRSGSVYPGFTDPASTGGMLDALARGALGPPTRLPPELRDIVRVFRASR